MATRSGLVGGTARIWKAHMQPLVAAANPQPHSRALRCNSSSSFNSLQHAPHRGVVKAHARSVLEELDKVLRGVTDEQYCERSSPEFYASTVGGHVRHILDHLRCVLCAPPTPALAPASASNGSGSSAPGLAGPVLRYDRRSRGTAVEAERGAALLEVQQLRSRLESLPLGQGDSWVQPMQVCFVADAMGTEYTLPSTLERELSFAAHHAVHHMASVQGMLLQAGLGLREGVGLAPSTKAHLQAGKGKGKGKGKGGSNR